MNLPDVQKNQDILCIYGAGSLGLAVAGDALLGLHGQETSRPTLKIFGWTANTPLLGFEFRSLRTGQVLTSPFTSSPLDALEDDLREQVLKSPTRLRSCGIVVTPPPQELESAVQRILNWVTAHQEEIKTGGFALSVFVLANGLMLPESWQRAAELMTTLPNFQLVRGIVVAGFSREFRSAHVDSSASRNDPSVIITHTSGSDLFWGLPEKLSSRRDPESRTLGTQVAPGSVAFAGPIFKLHTSERIRSLELQKFFTNAVLGWWIGNRNLPNGSLSTLLSQDEALTLAREFCAAWAPSDPTLIADCCSFLWHTVATTASNINSVSAAWVRGDARLAAYFRDTLMARLTGSQSTAEGLWLKQFNCMP